MSKEFIPYEQAIELKQLGFNETCLGYYHTELSRSNVDLVIKETPDRFYHLIRIPEHFDTLTPLYQQAFRWFRENYNLLGGVYSNASGWLWEIHDNIGGTHRFGCDYEGDCEHSGTYTSFDKAELACLKKLIEIAKNKLP